MMEKLLIEDAAARSLQQEQMLAATVLMLQVSKELSKEEPVE
jgi:hypothetical protein